MLKLTTVTDERVYWSVERCEDSHKFFDDDNRPTPVTSAIIECMYIVGITNLTEATLQEFYRRVKIHEYLNGAILHRNGQPVDVTFTLLKKFVGAKHTGYKISKAKFRDLIAFWVEANVQHRMEMQIVDQQPATA
jgi:hypothetical protein